MPSDNRQVVLLKSKRTLNRFYTLVSPDRGWKNAEEIDDFPEDVILGIAYPCLEDGLNDFAVIRSTFETIDCFPDDTALRDDLMVMVIESRDNLNRRLTELKERLAKRQAHFLGTDLAEFKAYTLNLASKGYIRRTLDNMMKLDVFESVAETEAQESGDESASMYHYEFRSENDLSKIKNLNALDFVVRLFEDVISSAMDETSYQSKFTFDRYVFQKFIALMFINYATTDPIFYGTNKADYGVAMNKDMSDTPLYKAVGEALRDIEKQIAEEPGKSEEEITRSTMHSRPVIEVETGAFAPSDEEDTQTQWDLSSSEDGESVSAFDLSSTEAEAETPAFDLSAPQQAPPPKEPAPAASVPAPSANGRTIHLPDNDTTEQRLMVPLNSIVMAAELLKNSGGSATLYAQMISTSVDALQATLKEWGIIK
jgi:hypothetical protein